ncbi:TPR repeat protein oca3 [Penicillium rolfsii]|nr:TPR repeat protein oca3 [Penicillium rolfsii]
MGGLADAELNGSDVLSALRLSQQAPAILGHGPASSTPVASVKSSRDTAEEYSRLEQLFLACLQTGDDQSAQTCLDRLSHRFGPSNERVMGLRGLFQEAIAKDQTALEKCLTGYEAILSENPVNVPIMKRRIALLRSLQRPTDAISALIQLLDAIPTDAEAWGELIHARLGELLYVCSSSSEGDPARLAGKSVQHFCRSIELCDDYLRGFYGLVLATSRMLDQKYAPESPSDPAVPSRKTIQQLQTFALQRLEHIVQSRSVDDQHWASSRSELIAAKELLNRFAPSK